MLAVVKVASLKQSSASNNHFTNFSRGKRKNATIRMLIREQNWEKTFELLNILGKI